MNTTVQVYKNVPFKWVAKKDRCYDVYGYACNPPSLLAEISDWQTYEGLTTSFTQANGQLPIIDISGGELPDYTVVSAKVGCMAASGQNYTVLRPGSYSNFTVHGTLTINQSTGVVSGFSANNYLELPDAFPTDQPWEIFIKFTTSTLPYMVWQGVFATDGQGLLPFYVVPTSASERKFYAYMSSNGSSWDICESPIMVASANTTYKMKLEYTGSAYNYYLFENDDWSLFYTLSSSTPVKSDMNLIIGKYSSDYFRGSVDLSETYINVNGSLWWSPNSSTSVTATGLLASGVTDDGTAKTYNLFYNGTQYLLDTAATKTGYTWVGDISVPAHSVVSNNS